MLQLHNPIVEEYISSIHDGFDIADSSVNGGITQKDLRNITASVLKKSRRQFKR